MSFTTEVTLPNGKKYTQPTGLFINNEFVAGNDKKIDAIDPYTGKTLCTVESADEKDVDKAVDAAEAAKRGWRDTHPSQRAVLLNKMADLIERDADIIAAIETADNGKAFTMARHVDLVGSVSCFRYYAGWADKLYGQTMEMGSNGFGYTKMEPFGVCGQIIPWNFPFLMWAWKIAPALATGNVVVLKSAEQTPLSALYGAALIKEAGFPAGTVNVITGLGKVAGHAIAAHPKIRKVAFTGSTVVGRQIMKTAAESNLKKVTLELGGKSPHIVFADADFDKAVEAVATGIFFNQGQVCTAGSRAYVQDSIYPKFLEALKARTDKVACGDPFDPKTFNGPQVSQIQVDRINELVNNGIKGGAKVIAGGGDSKLGGLFIAPTVIADADASSPLHNEIFGPVLCISPFSSIEEVVQKANDTEYGLAAGLHTRSIDTALRMADELEAGTVWINQYGAATPQLPFGGYKQSGIGRENGEAVLHEYLQTKTVNIARQKVVL